MNNLAFSTLRNLYWETFSLNSNAWENDSTPVSRKVVTFMGC